MYINLFIGSLLAIMVSLFACSSNKSAATKLSNGNKQEVIGKVANKGIPPCIQKMIDSTKKLDPGLQIMEIRRFKWNGAMVYLVAAPCCDQFNVAYDSACNYLFAPSGGFTGQGDRSNPNFFSEAKEDSLIWRQGK